MDGSDRLSAARVAWCREISQHVAVHDPGKILALMDFVDQAHAAGAKDLASNLLARAAQRCLWSNANSDVRASVLLAASRLDLPELDSRLIAILAYVEPLGRGGEVYTKLKALSARSIGNANIGRLLGSAANIIGAFDPAESYEYSDNEVCGNMYRKLIVPDPLDADKLVGDLAEKWEVSKDGLTFIFQIRKGVLFESGKPLTVPEP